MFTKEITVMADVKNLEAVTAFVDEGLEQFDCSPPHPDVAGHCGG